MKPKLKPHRHPPQPNRTFISHKAEANKSLIIGIVAIIAVVGLGLLLFFSKQFVGKAYYTGGVNSIGVVSPGEVVSDTPFTVTVKANLGTKNTVGILFELDYPDELECTDVKSLLNWGDDALIYDTECDNSNREAIFEYATPNYMLAKSGEVEIANITFKGVKEGSYNLTIGRIKILDLDTGQEITLTLEEAEIIVVAPKEKPICTDSDNGIDFNVKGTVNGYLTTEKKEIGTLSDTCVAAATGNEEDTHKELLRSKVVHELSCSPEDVISHSWHHCGETRECVEGKCVPIKSEPYCGNGVIDAGETCDDGNAVDEDGCSATCTVEEGWTCSGVPSRCCFDSDGGYNLSVWGWAIGVNEAANLFGTYNDSCSNEGKILERTCTSDSKVKINSQDCPSGTHCKDGACVAGAVCGNSILETGEQCDNTTFTVENCTSKGFKGGTPTCTNCIVNYSSCTRHTVGETCTLFTLGALASTCADGLTCEKNNIGALVCTSSIPPVAIVKPIDIKLTPVGSLIATTSVGKGKEYDITVTLTPSINLSAGYLMIASVNYGSNQSTKLIEGNNPLLTKDSSKTFGFKHTVDGSATNLTVSVMVWNGYLSEGFAWTELVPVKDKTYQIS